jgi:hypothetical protein
VGMVSTNILRPLYIGNNILIFYCSKPDFKLTFRPRVTPIAFYLYVAASRLSEVQIYDIIFMAGLELIGHNEQKAVRGLVKWSLAIQSCC